MEGFSGEGRKNMNNAVKCPMLAKVKQINVNEGDVVSPETVVVVLEAMAEMEIQVEAEVAGTVSTILAKIDSTVKKGDILMLVDS